MYRGIQQQPVQFSKKRRKALSRPDGLMTNEPPQPSRREYHPSKKTAKKGFHKVSKRTTPTGDLKESPPQHINSEGKRWVTNLAKQARVKGKLFLKKALKRK